MTGTAADRLAEQGRHRMAMLWAAQVLWLTARPHDLARRLYDRASG